MRGKLPSISSGNDLTRITPAGAGKTMHSLNSVQAQQDHPRRCGENDLRLVRATYAIGSPPQVRGKPIFALTVADELRITPAGAGKTILCRRVTVGYEDHPRRCGENGCSFR